MANESLLQALFAQAWQLAALSLVVAGCARCVARNRPHLAHALWLVVLLKCVTPPVWHSPIGVFSWLSPAGGETPAVETSSDLAAAQRSPGVFPVDADGALGPADVTVDARAGADPVASPIDLLATAAGADGEASIASTPGWLGPAAISLWATGVIAMAIVSAVRFGVCWRRLRRSEVETHSDLEALVGRLTKTLRVRRAARLLVTDSRIGPAVIGLWRPTILLPACVVYGRTAAELEPIVAHELIHVRRGDLWVGMLQTVAQALWWFHPLVWLAGRMISREAERCCDEEVIGELRCDPARYARSLLSVLEWKRILIPVPAAPGVRAIEITSKRLERIMTLGQGCRRRTPWWCWGAMLLAAALALPGSPLTIAATEPEAPTPGANATSETSANLGAQPAPRANNQKPAPVVFPAERATFPDPVEVQHSGKPFQAWGVSDLLDTIEKELSVDRPEAKRILWLRLLNAQLESHTPPRPLEDLKDVSKEPATAKPEEADGEPYWHNDTLVLAQHPQRRKKTDAALAEMRKFGFESVELEVRFITAPLENVTDVSNRWTTLAMKPPGEANEELNVGRTPPANAASSGVASFVIEKNLPVIFDVLGDVRTKKLIDNVQGERRANLLQAPRVRVTNGQTAAVYDCTQTPFVVGFKDDKPQISIVTEGTTVRARPVLDGDKARLDFEVILSAIRNVEEQKVRGPDGEQTTIHSPEVAQSRVAASVDVPLGQTVLIGGLKDVSDPKKKASLGVLLTLKKAPVERVAANRAPADQTPQDATPEFPTYSILGPITSGRAPATFDPPTEAEVMRALERGNPAWKKAPQGEKDRKNVRMTIESVSEYLDPQRVYPLIGTAQLHHARYKCTIDFHKSTQKDAATPSRADDKEKREIFLVDRTHFHLVSDKEDAKTQHIRILGSQKSKLTLAKHHGLKLGDPLSPAAVEDARSKLEIWYRAKGYSQAKVTTIEGDKPGDLGATWEVNEGPKQKESAEIDKKKNPEPPIFAVTYAVADLVIPFPNPVVLSFERATKPAPAPQPDFHPLEELLTSTVLPESWEAVGGPCAIARFPKNFSLVITQTQAGHDQIATLFKQLRSKLDKQVVLDCRMVEDPAELFRLKQRSDRSKGSGIETFPAEVVEQAHRLAEAKGGMNPKLTVFSGQQLKLRGRNEASDGPAKYVMIQPTISEDGRQIRMRIANGAEGDQQPWLQTDFSVLDCGSILIDTAKYPIQPLSNMTIPAEGAGAGKPNQPHFLLMTPRIIDANPPKEEKPARR